MVLACKLSRCGWSRPKLDKANRPQLEILSEIPENRNESRVPAELNGTENRRQLSEATLSPSPAELNLQLLITLSAILSDRNESSSHPGHMSLFLNGLAKNLEQLEKSSLSSERKYPLLVTLSTIIKRVLITFFFFFN